MDRGFEGRPRHAAFEVGRGPRPHRVIQIPVAGFGAGESQETKPRRSGLSATIGEIIKAKEEEARRESASP
jgi:hypothetical protein